MSIKDSLQSIRAIAQGLDEDDPDKIEMMNIEGDYTVLMEWALRKRNEALAMEDACKTLADLYKGRADKFARKSDGFRDVAHALMAAANEKSFKGAAGTATIKTVPPRPYVVDESLVPPEYTKTKIAIDKTAINAAVKLGKSIPGVAMDNGGVTLQIRTK